MSNETDREALVDTLVMTPMADRHGAMAPVYRTADAILTSDWLAADRAATRRQVLDEALREIRARIRHMSQYDPSESYMQALNDAWGTVANLRDGGGEGGGDCPCPPPSGSPCTGCHPEGGGDDA